MNTKRVTAAAGVIHAAQRTRQTATGIAVVLEAAGLLQSPESAAEQLALVAEVDKLRALVTELEARPAPSSVLRGVADEWSAQCPEHSDADEVWMSCPGEWVYELHLAADAFEAGVRAAPAPVDPWEQSVAAYLSTPYTDDTTPAPTEDPHDSPLHHTYETGRDLPRRPGACDACGDVPKKWCPDCAACRQGCHGGHDGNPCSHPRAPWGGAS